MADAEAVAAAPDRLLELVGRLERQAGFAEIVESLIEGRAATLDGVWGSSCALVAAALAGSCPAALVVVCPRIDQVDELIDDLALFTRLRPESLPGVGIGGSSVGRRDFWPTGPPVEVGCGQPSPPKLIVTSIQGLLQPVLSREALERQTRRLRVGDVVAVEELARWLTDSGFLGTPAVDLSGEFSVRGGIVDIFAPDWDEPVRVEFFGDQIESIRRFEISSQRSLESLREIDVTIVGMPALPAARTLPTICRRKAGSCSWSRWSWSSRGGSISNGWSRRRRVQGSGFRVQILRISESPNLQIPKSPVSNPQSLIPNPSSPALFTVSEVLSRVCRFPSVTASAVAAASLEATCRLKIESVERFSGEIGRVREELDEAAAGQEVFVVCQTEAEVRRLSDVFATTEAAREGRLLFPIGTLHAGFRLVPERIVLLSSGELFHRADLRRPAQRRLTRIIDSFLELREGDLVVHVGHGVGRYRGLKLLEKNGQVEEHLELEFQGRTKLYVPAAKIGLVQKYVGGSKSRPTLAKLGGRFWGRQKERVEQSVTDLAAEMLELQAARASRPGIAFPADTEWQREFDASFPYRETPIS